MADFPDPNFDFEYSAWSDRVDGVSVDLSSLGRGLHEIVTAINGGAKSQRANDSNGALEDSRAVLEAVAILMSACAQAHREMRYSAGRYDAAAPRLAEVQQAKSVADAARTQMMIDESAAAELAYREAVARLKALRDRRDGAKAALEADDGRIAATLQSAVAGVTITSPKELRFPSSPSSSSP
ncbi:hypothetical protein, partial [Mycolicibacillus koreensis]